MTVAIEAEHLTRTYRDVTAVDDVSFRIDEHQIVGLLGRNGAGKTTILRLLSAQEVPSAGAIRIFGVPPWENERVLQQLCVVRDRQPYRDLRVAEVLACARLLQPRWDHAFALSLVAEFSLPMRRKVRALSGGMRSALGIVVGLASRAPITLFDEPYLGLDAPSRQLFYDRLLADYSDHPRTVLLSTHLIDEVANLLERVIVVERGRVAIDEEAESLRGRASTVSGSAQGVARFAAGRRVAFSQTLGSRASAVVLGALDEADRRLAADLGVNLAALSMQQLVVLATSENAQDRELAAEGAPR